MSRYLVFSTVSVALILSAIGGTSVSVAFPVITASFNVSLVLAGWIISIYQLGLTATMPIVGKISDVMGRKSTFMVCLALFMLGSLLCAIAPNVESLILFRLIQSLGGGGFMPSAVGIVAEQFPQSRQKAIGLFSSVFPIGLIIGPNLGGWLVSSFGWRSIFWINVPVGLITLVASALLLHPSKRIEEKIDLIGAGLVGGSISAFMFGLSLLGYEKTRLMALVPCLAAFIFLFLLVRHEKRTEDPILDFEVLSTKPFMAANTYNFVYGCAVIGVMSLVPVFAVSVYGMNALECGLLLTPRSVGMIVASTVTSIFIEKFGYRRPMIAGTTLTVAGLLFLSYEPGSIALLYVIMGLLGLAVGAISPAANNACIELMPERAATITGVRGMFRQIGGALSITVATLVFHTVGDMALGFRIIFIGIAVAFIAAIPLIFLMPSSPGHK